VVVAVAVLAAIYLVLLVLLSVIPSLLLSALAARWMHQVQIRQ
jgi:hypothetical protein